ncbi:MAG: Mur ligase family protein, partial [Patescibacteria group bacterium]
MVIKNLKNKLIAVLGYGQEGEAVARYLLKHGIQPVLFDQRPWEDWTETKKLEIKKLGVNFIFGPDAFLELTGFDVAFKSPGIRPKLITDSKLLITSQTKYFFENCAAKIIGVTGTKGKGTTSALVYEILSLSLRGSASDRSNLNLEERLLLHSDALMARNGNPIAYLTGNIGKQQPLDILDDLNPNDWIIYELSSFQLQDLDKSPHIAVVLMITSEHLDYHKDNNEYISAKSAITKFQGSDDIAIINEAYPASVQIGKQGRGKKIYFSAKKIPELIDKSKIQLRGEHNLENIAAAAAVGTALGINTGAINAAAANFKGLEHRLEFVGESQGIKFYNDSFSTTPETAIAGIRSFT